MINGWRIAAHSNNSFELQSAEREANIIHNRPSIGALRSSSAEAYDLVNAMIQHNPRNRPTAKQICEHPYFWTLQRKLSFMCDLSDRLETDSCMSENDPHSAKSAFTSHPLAIERNAINVVGLAWDKTLYEGLTEQRYRTYDPSSVRDLLRLLRNKKNHFQDLDPSVRRKIGSDTDGLMQYFDYCFPKLLMHCYHICCDILPPDDTLVNKYSLTSSFQSEPIIEPQKSNPLGSVCADGAIGLPLVVEEPHVDSRTEPSLAEEETCPDLGRVSPAISTDYNAPDFLHKDDPDVPHKNVPDVLHKNVPDAFHKDDPEAQQKDDPDVLQNDGPYIQQKDGTDVQHQQKDDPDVQQKDDPDVQHQDDPDLQQKDTIDTDSISANPASSNQQQEHSLPDTKAGSCARDATENSVISDANTEALTPDIPDPQVSDNIHQALGLVLWEGSTASKTLNCRGWIRSDEEWTSRSVGGKKRNATLLRCAEDPKFRTRLCNHWDTTLGTSCPMRKKNKCVFAHGPVELRVKEGKRHRWGKLVDKNGNNSNLYHSGGEDTYGAARSIETVRKEEGKWSTNKGANGANKQSGSNKKKGKGPVKNSS